MVEANRDVARDLDVLTLVVSDRHLVRVVQQDVRSLQGRVGEETGRDEVGLAFGGLVLELGHATQLAVRDGALHDPTQL